MVYYLNFNTHKHSSPEIEFVEELCNKDMYFEDVGDILAFNIAKHVDEPFKVFM